MTTTPSHSPDRRRCKLLAEDDESAHTLLPAFTRAYAAPEQMALH